MQQNTPKRTLSPANSNQQEHSLKRLQTTSHASITEPERTTIVLKQKPKNKKRAKRKNKADKNPLSISEQSLELSIKELIGAETYESLLDEDTSKPSPWKESGWGNMENGNEIEAEISAMSSFGQSPRWSAPLTIVDIMIMHRRWNRNITPEELGARGAILCARWCGQVANL